MSQSGVAVEDHTGKTCRHCSEPITGSALIAFRYRSTPAAVEIIHFHKLCIESLLHSPSGMMIRIAPGGKGKCPRCGEKGGDVTFANGRYQYGSYHASCIRSVVDNSNWVNDAKYEHFIQALKVGSFEEKKKFFKEKKVGYIDRLTSSLDSEELKIYIKANSAAKKRVEEALKQGDARNLVTYVRKNWEGCSDSIKLSFLRHTNDLKFYNRVKQEIFYPPTRETLQELYHLTFGGIPLSNVFREDYGNLIDNALRTGVIQLEDLLDTPKFYFVTSELVTLGAKYFSQIKAELNLIEERSLISLTNHSDFHLLPVNVQDELNEALLMSKEGERILSKSF